MIAQIDSHRALLKRVFGILLFCLLAGCSPATQVKQRYFWPPYSEPKIEYVEFFQADADLRKITASKVEEAIFGQFAPESLFFNPFDVYSDGRGKFYVSEIGQRYVLAVDLTTGKFEPLTDRMGGIMDFKFPTGLDGDSHGRVYVVDSLAKKVLVFATDGKLQEVWPLEWMGRPVNIAIDEQRQKAYLADPKQHSVHVISLVDGSRITSFGERGNIPGTFNFPLDLDLDASGNLFVLDSMNARIQVFTPEGEFVREFGERGTAIGSFQVPKGIAVSPSGHVYITDSMANRFVIFDLEGNFLMTVGGKFIVNEGVVAPGGFYLPGGIDVDREDGIWVVDAMNRIIHRFQYLNAAYLKQNPIVEGQAVKPEVPGK